MVEKKTQKKKETKKEIQDKIEAEKFVFEKAKEAEEAIEEKEEEVIPSRATVQKESKLLRNTLLILGLVALVVAFIIILNNASKTFTVDGVTYAIVKLPGTFYNTKIPAIINGSLTSYNFYLYDDPRIIKKTIPFNGSMKINLGEITVLNVPDSLNCKGDGMVAAVNLANLYGLVGKVIKDFNATCDLSGRYLYINVQEANKTGIQQTAPACYNINVNNCEILPAAERFMMETFATIRNMSASK